MRRRRATGSRPTSRSCTRKRPEPEETSMRRAIVLIALIATGVAVSAFQQQPPAGGGRGQQGPRVVGVEKLKDNLFVLRGMGGGGNTAVFVQASGVTVVDTKNPGWGTPIL